VGPAPETRNLKKRLETSRRETRNLKPQTRNSNLETRNRTPEKRNPNHTRVQGVGNSTFALQGSIFGSGTSHVMLSKRHEQPDVKYIQVLEKVDFP